MKTSPDEPDLERRLRAVGAEVTAAQEAVQGLYDVRVTGTSQHGLATAVVTGPGRVEQVWIDPDAVESYDAESVAMLVMDAIRNGYVELDSKVQARADALPLSVDADLVGSPRDPGA